MICPRCRTRMSTGTLDSIAAMADLGPYRSAPAPEQAPDEPDDIRVGRCGHCAGLYFPGGALERALRSMAIVAVPDPPREPRTHTELCACPGCSQTMAMMFSRAARVIFDRCNHCGGVWLDAGEVSRFASPLVALSAMMPGDATRLGGPEPVKEEPVEAFPDSVEIAPGGKGPALVRLCLIAPDGSERRFHTRSEIIKIGRLSSAHIRLEDPEASRLHAVIEVSESKVNVIDLGSARGTKVNGARVTQQALAVGDRLGMGDSEVVVEAIERGGDA